MASSDGGCDGQALNDDAGCDGRGGVYHDGRDGVCHDGRDVTNRPRPHRFRGVDCDGRGVDCDDRGVVRDGGHGDAGDGVRNEGGDAAVGTSLNRQRYRQQPRL